MSRAAPNADSRPCVASSPRGQSRTGQWRRFSDLEYRILPLLLLLGNYNSNGVDNWTITIYNKVNNYTNG